MSSRMSQMTALGADWWNDSGVPGELSEAVALGAVGGTSNPVIVAQAVKAQPALCHPLIDRLLAENPADTEDDIAWKLIHTLALDAASRLLPVFQATKGVKGWLSVQVNPKYYPSKDRMVAQATQLAALAPNIAIKAPATAVGLDAIEEMTARGIRVNATVSFTVPQALAVSAALERGLRRAHAAGRDTDAIRPYITLMIGRVGTLLAAAYRHEGHWSQIIGREVLQTVPYGWWTKFNASPTVPELTVDRPVDPALLAELRAKFPDFVRAHDENGLPPSAFLGYGATQHTLKQFLGGYDDLIASVRARMLP